MGRQINKRLAQSGDVGALAYGAVLGAGILTIIATPAVWLGLSLSLLMGSWKWGAIYGFTFGTGRALMIGADRLAGRANHPYIGLRIIERQLSPRSMIRMAGLAGGIGMLLLGAAVLA